MEATVISPAAQVIVSLIPIVGITFGAIVVFFYILWHHHETKLQIKTGTFVPKKIDGAAFSLLAGLLLTGVGIILTLVFAIISGFSFTILGGLIPMAVGICFLIFYKIFPGFHKQNDDQQPAQTK